jgi:hypothetical protein
MGSNERKLMPYEHQLVECLGITKEDYLDFVAQQQIYSDPKEGTVLDVRNSIAVVALVLVIVGTILQVVGALLVKREDQPSGRAQTRDDVFAPRAGFNSVQQLAEYGDPINLVYTDIGTNPNGGVRVATALLWSSVKSFGSSQYVQLLLLIGAGQIGSIDASRSAFGQTPLRDLIAQNYWLYFKPNDTGALRRSSLLQGSESKNDPGTIGAGLDNIYRISPATSGPNGDGFSHAISPSTSNVFGIYSPVPINIDIEVRNEGGDIQRARNEIEVRGLGNWDNRTPDRAGARIEKGESMTVTLASTTGYYGDSAREEASESRRTASNAFDSAGVMKLGSAKFSIVSIDKGSTDDGDMTVRLNCVEGGYAPSIIYSAVDPQESAQKIANSDPLYQSLQKTTEQLLQEDSRNSISTAEDLLADGRIFVTEQYSETVDPATLQAQQAVSPNATQTRTVFKRNLTNQEKQVLRDYISYRRDIASGSRIDDSFFTKALVKIETAYYETVSPCHIVDFAIKARVWRRISGRQEKYGSEEKKGYPVTDNGIKRRTSMFIVKYKREGEQSYSYVQGIFVVRRAADVDNFVYFRFDSGIRGPLSAKHWQFEIEPVHDAPAEFFSSNLTSSNGEFRFFYLENAGNERRFNLQGSAFLSFVGEVRNGRNKFPPLNNSPRDSNEWDIFSNTADTQLQMSFDQGPEFSITAVTEQISESFANYSNLYNSLSLAGFNMYSGRNVQDLRSLSMFVNQGRRCRLLRTSGTVAGFNWGQADFQYLPPNVIVLSSELIVGTPYYITTVGSSNWTEAGVLPGTTIAVGTVFIAKKAVSGSGQAKSGGYANRAPDIFIDTILDKSDGIGRYSGDLFSVDVEQLARSKKFCEKNGLFMDGVIAEPESWRQFWASKASFSLLELAKIDGKEALIPGVPYDKATGRIASKETLVPVEISALFNQGNILEDSYKEEFIDYGANTQDVVVTVIYRDNENRGAFPKKSSVNVFLSDFDGQSAVRETVDASQFVTNKSQAILLGKLLCQTRRHSRRAIEFKTFPTDSYVGPSAYIYVELAQNQWDKIYSGTIGSDGTLNLPIADSVNNDSYQFLMYNPDDQSAGTVFKNSVAVVGNRAASLAAFNGFVFVLGKVIRNKRTFRVTEVAMDEEGEVSIRAIEHPTDADGYSLITRGLADRVAGLFNVDNMPE